MSDVALSIGGRSYTVACADGEEDHLRMLAAMIDGKLTDMGANQSPQEAKNLLFAALLLADEVHDARNRPPPPPAPAPPPDNAALAGNLERIATALENAATTLEGGLVASGSNP